MAHKSYGSHPSIVKTVERIGNRAMTIKGERDQIAHGQFGSSGLFLQPRGGKTVQVSDRIGTPEHLEDLACRISDISAVLFNHRSQVEQLFGVRR
jgi:hypothetical protein